GVDKVAFTGSTEVGQQVMVAAAKTVKKVTLELGGKSPNIVFSVADLKQAARNAYWGTFLNSEQACPAAGRRLLQRGVHDGVRGALAELDAPSLVGDPLADQTMIGPLADEGQLRTVMDNVEQGSQQGARRLYGGGRIERDGLAA